MGDVDVEFCLQSTSKPLNYALALSDMGSNRVHDFVGQEPSGRSFNELTLDHNREYTLWSIYIILKNSVWCLQLMDLGHIPEMRSMTPVVN